jgi:hypothetical protein
MLRLAAKNKGIDMDILTASATQKRGVCSAEKTSEKDVDRFVPIKYKDVKPFFFFMASMSANVDSLFPVFSFISQQCLY